MFDVPMFFADRRRRSSRTASSCLVGIGMRGSIAPALPRAAGGLRVWAIVTLAAAAWLARQGKA